MAIQDYQKVDFLWKKILFGVSNTTTAGKEGYNEIYSSPVPTYANNIWTQSSMIQTPAPEQTVGVHEFYSETTAIECMPDPTVAGNRSWIAVSTHGDLETRLGDWIAPTFDPTYLVTVYHGDPNNGGEPLNQGTSDEEWVFDYITGVLNFVNTVPTNVNDNNPSNRIFIVGHRYVGSKGITGSGGAAASYVVADIVERDALTVNEGDMVHVKNAYGDVDNRAHIGDGEYANYIYDGSNWILTATQDSAEADSGSHQYSIDSSSVSGAMVGVRSGTRITGIVVDVTEAFDGVNSSLDIGDDIVSNSLVQDELVDLTEVGTYTIDSTKVFDSIGSVTYLLDADSSTQGNATIIIRWES